MMLLKISLLCRQEINQGGFLLCFLLLPDTDRSLDSGEGTGAEGDRKQCNAMRPMLKCVCSCVTLWAVHAMRRRTTPVAAGQKWRSLVSFEVCAQNLFVAATRRVEKKDAAKPREAKLASKQANPTSPRESDSLCISGTTASH